MTLRRTSCCDEKRLNVQLDDDEEQQQQQQQQREMMTNFHHLIHHVLVPVSKEGLYDFTPFQRRTTIQTAAETRPSLLLLLLLLRKRAEQERAVLRLLLTHVNMDPTLLSRPPSSENDGNWLEYLHSAVEKLVPDAFLKVYRCSSPPSDHEWDLMMTENSKFVHGRKLDNIEVVEEQTLLKRYRDRGWIFKSSTMYHFNVLVIDAVQHCTSFAIPNRAILEKIISQCGPIVEVGAGTGYWTALLRAHGVDIIAYDKAPPGADLGASQFFDQSYTTVLHGDASSETFWKKDSSSALGTRSLLMVWPNNPDKIDNPHFYHGEDIPSVWDADCLAHYMASGGQTVIYVGEREDKITISPDYSPDCGICASRRFQGMLKEHFDMVEQVDIPNWYWCEDDATIWRRKKTC